MSCWDAMVCCWVWIVCESDAMMDSYSVMSEADVSSD
jgi:hypothetical protein